MKYPQTFCILISNAGRRPQRASRRLDATGRIQIARVRRTTRRHSVIRSFVMKRKIALSASLICALLALAVFAARPNQAKADGFFLSTGNFSLGISTRPSPPPAVVYDVAPPRSVVVVGQPPLGPPPAAVRVAPPPPRHYPPFDPYSRRPAYAPRPYPNAPHYGGLTPMPGPRPGGPRPGGPMGPGGPHPGGPRPGGPRF